MISSYGWFERREDKDLSVGIDLEDRTGAVADVQIAVAIERDAGGDSHAFGVRGDSAIGGDAVDGSFGARAGVEVAFAIEGEACGIDEVAHEGKHLKVTLDAKDGDGRRLSTRSR